MLRTINHVVKELIQYIPIPTLSQIDDVVRWGGSTDGLYTVASAYHWLGIESRGWSTVNSSSWLWRVKIPAKIQWITWLVTKDALPVNLLRFHRGLS
ncbi:hypothetical protein RIF29_33612 [Crotalaria pallida]|uniref:Reverse transcriptase zinc-binding domain-containing protein n=1 Tax=Crotalaria pallida TaxID=3830 RepID=A0AAN9E8B2_CROPI